LEMDYQALVSIISLLTEMEKEYQGYSKAVKTVMQESSRGTLKGIHGTIGSLVKVSDKFALAIETALGGAMQNIIVTREEDGKAAINMLKRRDAGRATFEPLSRKGSVLKENGLEDEEGFEGLAIELVTFDDKYSGIFTSLLGRTAVVENLDDAIRIARKYSNRFRIVTLDGQVMNAGGSMTGGSATKNAGILSRSNELKALAERKTDLEQQLRDAESKRKAANAELEESEYELSVTRERQQGILNNVLKLETDSNHYAMLIQAAQESIDALKADSNTLKARLEANGKEIASCRNKCAELESELSQVQNEITEMSAGKEELTEKYAQFTADLADVREKQASLSAEKTAENSSAEELEKLRLGLEGGRDRQVTYIENLRTRSEEIKGELAVKRKQISDISASTARLKERIEKITEEKLAIEGERTRHNRESQDRNNHLLNLQHESSSVENKLLAAEMEEKQIIDKLWDTYELSRSAAIEQRVEIENVAEAKKEAAELKRSISRLGSPNLGAIEEFERVNTRYTYLTQQRDDIENAKSELTGIISDITDEMRDIFAREFESINKQFKETFLELFGGGRADLELEDENDILNCGIEIKVQPPGKSLKTITLLSGGEKAFVAIALYFAVLKVRPAPFVVMDEIEAALDEANVQRFAEYMRRMTDGTQMVVITHRRGTMEEADILYGVTMQEQGVSRVLDIDLEEAERTISEN
ncbi:MAG: chromosome segregation protein SMC, partial [Oscillospiraceae bacterium]|nr:chromosome segregation protein SMC [Oscillospiraceae bacterium]